MSWHYSRALVEAFSEGTCSDGEQCAQSSGNPTQLAYLSPDRMTAFSRLSRFGMTFKPLTGSRGEELLTLFLAAFPVKTSAQREKEQESTAQDQECGRTWRESFAKYNPDSCSWKTAQCSLLADSDEFSETWPRWGSMRNGESYQQPMLALPISESESGYWPTPVASDLGDRKAKYAQGGTPLSLAIKWPTPKARDAQPEGLQAGMRRIAMHSTCGLSTAVQLMPTPTVNGNYNRKGLSKTSGDGLATYVAKFPTPTKRDHKGSPKNRGPSHPRHADNLDSFIERADGAPNGRLNPEWVEWLMGWPIGATALSPLAMDKFHEWQQQHGSCFLNDSTIKAK